MRVYRHKEDIVTRKVAGETLLVPIRGELADLQKVFVLQGIGEFVWQKIDGVRNQAAITDDILEEFEVDRTVASQDTKAFLEELSQAGLIEDVQQG